MLPLRLHDIELVRLVTDDILNNDKELFKAMKKNLTYTDTIDGQQC